MTNRDLQFQVEYEQQRKNRLGDAIIDYFSDSGCDSRRIYEEILSEVESTITYHKEHYERASDLYQLLQGNRPGVPDS